MTEICCRRNRRILLENVLWQIAVTVDLLVLIIDLIVAKIIIIIRIAAIIVVIHDILMILSIITFFYLV